MLRDEFQVTHSHQGHQFRIPSDTHAKTHRHLNSHCCVRTNPHMHTKPHTYSQINTQSQVSYTHTHTHSLTDMLLSMSNRPPHILTHHTCTAVLHSYTQTHEDRSIISAPCTHAHTPSSQSVLHPTPPLPHKVSVSVEFTLSQIPSNAIALVPAPHYSHKESLFHTLTTLNTTFQVETHIFSSYTISYLLLLPLSDLGSLKAVSFQLTRCSDIVMSSSGQLFQTVSSFVCESLGVAEYK